MHSSGKSEAEPLLSSSADFFHRQEEDVDVGDVHIHVENRHNSLNRRERLGELSHNSDIEVAVQINADNIPEREREQQNPDRFKTFIAFTFLTGNMVWTLSILAIVHDRMPDRTKYPPLPDIFFDIFPAADWALGVSEVIIILCVTATIIMTVLHKQRYIILRRCFVIMGVLYFIRSITMFVTQVPVASTTYYCAPKANSTTFAIVVERVLHMITGFGLSINGRHVYCGDYIYSGHTVILTIAYLFIKEYCPKKSIHWLVWISSCLGVFMVLLSRGHYTVDVIIGYYVSSRVFWIYHTMANNSALKVKSNNNFLSRAFWFRIFRYFEGDVDGVVTWQYEWPLPCLTRRFLRRVRAS